MTDRTNVIELASRKQSKAVSKKTYELPTIGATCKDALLYRVHQMRKDSDLEGGDLQPKRGLDDIKESTIESFSYVAEQMFLAVSMILIARATPQDIEAIVTSTIASAGMQPELLQAELAATDICIAAIGAKLAAYDAPLNAQ
jgi:hypothetical protein